MSRIASIRQSRLTVKQKRSQALKMVRMKSLKAKSKRNESTTKKIY